MRGIFRAARGAASGVESGARRATKRGPRRQGARMRERALVEWITGTGLTGYDEAVAFMEARVDAIARGTADEAV